MSTERMGIQEGPYELKAVKIINLILAEIQIQNAERVKLYPIPQGSQQHSSVGQS
jgi:hypothetical protein